VFPVLRLPAPRPTTSQYALTLCHMVFPVLRLSALRPPASQCAPGLRHGSATTHLLGVQVQIPPGVWMFVSYKRCVLSGRGLCDRLIPCPEEYYQVCVFVCVRACVNECDQVQQ